MKNSTFARFARAFFIFGHLADVLDPSTTWNDLFCSCPDDVSMWWQMFNFVSLPLKRWFQFNSRIVWTHFASVMTLNNSEMIAEMRSYIFIWRSCCRRPLLCLNSLMFPADTEVLVPVLSWLRDVVVVNFVVALKFTSRVSTKTVVKWSTITHFTGIGTLKQSDHKYNKKENPGKDSFSSSSHFFFFLSKCSSSKGNHPWWQSFQATNASSW